MRPLLPELEYSEKRFWAQFRSPATQRTVAQLDPRKTQTRVFLCVPPSSDTRLVPGPATKWWGDRYPSLFFVRSDADAETAAELIRGAIAYDSGR